MRTALVVGGTGMLASPTRRLAAEFDVVGVVGPTPFVMSVILNIIKCLGCGE